jgi:7-carboxy-7-deazaguanine synthase
MIKVNEIFNSISGEISPYHQGCLTTFCRFSGCGCNCKYCDTDHKKHENLNYTELINRTKNLYFHTNRLCITGGEPLLQPLGVMELIDTFHNSWVETSGVVYFEPFIGKTSLVVDYKLDIRMKRGYQCETSVEDYLLLTKNDFIKFVIGDLEDFFNFKDIYFYLKQNGCKATISVSPIHTIVKPSELVQWCFNENINEVVLNVQLHKIIGLQ